jgi:DNA topoisomerase-1
MYKRCGNYKTGFHYIDNITKKRISDANVINVIKDMKIPPNYMNVMINSFDKNKKILAYGYDSKGRKQVIYNVKYVMKKNKLKYDKMMHFEKNNIFKKIVHDTRNNIKNKSDKKIKEICIIIYLIINCGFRIGNKKYRDENKSYGISTIKFKHIDVNTNDIDIKFVGKKGVLNVSKCNHKEICEYLKGKKKIYGSEDNVFENIESTDVNKYLRKYDEKITSKDLRTWNANQMFILYINKNIKDNVKNPIKKSIEYVACKLHNSYAICKKNYIDPSIIKFYENKIKK